MTTPATPESSFLAMARRITGTSSDEEALAVFQQATGLTGDPEADREEMARRLTVRARGNARWDCEAYGPEATAQLGPMCFFALSDPCHSETECKTRLIAERQRVFNRMRELAGSDGPDAEAYRMVLEGISRPDQLLGGPDSDRRA